MSSPAEQNLTRIRAALAGDPQEQALTTLLPSVYDELRRLAESLMRSERADHTLQTTALVHEAYVRLAGSGEPRWQDRKHFFRLAAIVMRHVLIDHAEARRAQKRGGGRAGLSLEEVTIALGDPDIDLQALDEALTDLGTRDRQKADVVELRFFGGCTIDETSETLGISTATVEREWRFARAWLRSRLAET